MIDELVTVEQAAERLHLHPKTVLRYIRGGRLAATRVGKAYRITRAKLDSFAGVVSETPHATTGVRATCIVDIPDISVDAAQELASFLQAAAMARRAGMPSLQLQTAFDPLVKSMKVVVIASPSDTADLLGMLHVRMETTPSG